jgi:hypothetical protein
VGDEMNFTLTLLAKFINAMEVLDVKYAIHDPIKLGKLNGNIKLPDPTLETLANFLNVRYYDN